MNAAVDNGFTGTIPSEIGFLTGLEELRLRKLKYFGDHLTA